MLLFRLLPIPSYKRRADTALGRVTLWFCVRRFVRPSVRPSQWSDLLPIKTKVFHKGRSSTSLHFGASRIKVKDVQMSYVLGND